MIRTPHVTKDYIIAIIKGKAVGGGIMGKVEEETKAQKVLSFASGHSMDK